MSIADQASSRIDVEPPHEPAAGRHRIEVEVPVAADAAAAFQAITDWAGQGRWMVGTRVWASRGSGHRVGDELSGWTGIGRLGFVDTMTITDYTDQWVLVEHTGRVVRGIGWMGVPRGGVQTRFVWGEDVELPLGLLGRIGWLAVRPMLHAGVKHSLRRLAALVETGEMPSR